MQGRLFEGCLCCRQVLPAAWMWTAMARRPPHTRTCTLWKQTSSGAGSSRSCCQMLRFWQHRGGLATDQDMLINTSIKLMTFIFITISKMFDMLIMNKLH